ncbi:uncharacterized protein TEOVI_000796000 [Trypanosoma equiperdum]|uniref:Uncharacterized protein n=1 Tax=Trypanosoma equiperdum TaxID=5694 RepID=A0A1G4I8J6_TRYEQ|nr:hypothetical protein, conserved [Trypanosoma equiperdum]
MSNTKWSIRFSGRGVLERSCCCFLRRGIDSGRFEERDSNELSHHALCRIKIKKKLENRSVPCHDGLFFSVSLGEVLPFMRRFMDFKSLTDTGIAFCLLVFYFPLSLFLIPFLRLGLCGSNNMLVSTWRLYRGSEGGQCFAPVHLCVVITLWPHICTVVSELPLCIGCSSPLHACRYR